MPVSASLPPEYFDAKYAEQGDPWGFETREYEAAKYQASLAVLPHPRYHSTFEIGCSIGVLTELLAARSDRLLAVDVAEQALERAHERVQHLPHVRIEQLRVPESFPDERFDLIIVSEVGYYWSRLELGQAMRLIVQQLELGGHLLLVHWTPFVADYPLTGDQVHDAFLTATTPRMRALVSRREPSYRLDLLERRGCNQWCGTQVREAAS